MLAIRPSPLPSGALLERYSRDGSYTDCYCVDVPRRISFTEYVSAFYTTPLFKIERGILAVLARRPSSDAGASALATGSASDFAAWSVEGRAADQLLLQDFLGRTRSWLMVAPIGGPTPEATRLYFGSAVVPISRPPKGPASFGFAFHALHGFHHLYTRALMRAAVSKLMAVRQ